MLPLAGCDAAPLVPGDDPPLPRQDAEPARPTSAVPLACSTTMQLVGKIGGNMSISIGGNRMECLVRSGELIRAGEGYHLVLDGDRGGTGSELPPLPLALGLRSGATLTNGDPWTIGGSTYIRDQGDRIYL